MFSNQIPLSFSVFLLNLSHVLLKILLLTKLCSQNIAFLCIEAHHFEYGFGYIFSNVSDYLIRYKFFGFGINTELELIH